MYSGKVQVRRVSHRESWNEPVFQTPTSDAMDIEGETMEHDAGRVRECIPVDLAAYADEDLERILPLERTPKAVFVTPGENIATNHGFLRGHGTFVDSEQKLYSTVSGTISRVNKLISVVPHKSRYVGAVGDIVVGRVIELSGNRWKLDVNGRQDAVLLLSSVNLPGGIQRRRSHQDQLEMRSFLKESDLVSAEVQQLYMDGTISLHTRSLKYGKLGSGQFVAVYPGLIKRCKSHVHSLSIGVDLILGNNGYCWITLLRATGASDEASRKARDTVTVAQREVVCRVYNAILLLQKAGIEIYVDTILDVYSSTLSVPPRDMGLVPSAVDAAMARVQQAKSQMY